MPIPYTEFRWFYPPRSASDFPYKPQSPILQMWKRQSDAVAQFKMNGTNDMVVVDRAKKMIQHWSRHKIDPRTKKSSSSGDPKMLDYDLPKAMADQVFDLTPNGLTVYNAELMHFKTTMVKDTLYFFDVLVWDGMHLLGVEYQDRYKIIRELFSGVNMPLGLPRISNQIYVAESQPASQWDGMWAAAQGTPYCEGLVLKREGAVSRLQQGDREKNNSGFIARIRKPTKNFQY